MADNRAARRRRHTLSLSITAAAPRDAHDTLPGFDVDANCTCVGEPEARQAWGWAWIGWSLTSADAARIAAEAWQGHLSRQEGSL